MRYFLPLFLFTTSLYAAQGDVTYSFKEGQVQFLSEKTPNGKVVGLLKTLKPNTSVESIKIDNKDNSLSFLMMVQAENPLCASWIDAQQVIIGLNPKLVDEITLKGKTALSIGNVTILTPNN